MFHPLTAQIGDQTFTGEYAVDGDQLIVRCAYGARTVMENPLSKPLASAERLLVEILRAAGKL